VSLVRVERDGARADVIMQRGDKLNALNWELFADLATAIDEVAAMEGVRVLVLAGEGRSFSAGIDTASFGDLGGNSPGGGVEQAQAPMRKLLSLPIPSIAAVQGHALGAGLQLALACDLRVVASDASLGLLEHRYGIVPDLGGTQRLPLLVGAARAKKMIWLAERVDGVEAERTGLAEVVVVPSELAKTVDDLASRIADAPPLAVAAAKRLIEAAGSVPPLEGMDREAEEQRGLLASTDFVEAITAFMEQREPRYKGE